MSSGQVNCHSKIWVCKIFINFFMFLWDVSYVHWGCIYFLIKSQECKAKQNFQHHYSSLQCHMILQKSFWFADLLLKKHFLLLFKTVVLLMVNSTVESVQHTVSQTLSIVGYNIPCSTFCILLSLANEVDHQSIQWIQEIHLLVNNLSNNSKPIMLMSHSEHSWVKLKYHLQQYLKWTSLWRHKQDHDVLGHRGSCWFTLVQKETS